MREMFVEQLRKLTQSTAILQKVWNIQNFKVRSLVRNVLFIHFSSGMIRLTCFKLILPAIYNDSLATYENYELFK